MFNTLVIPAKRVRIGHIVKMAGTKYTVGNVIINDDTVNIYFLSTSDMIRYSTYAVDKNHPVKIRTK